MDFRAVMAMFFENTLIFGPPCINCHKLIPLLGGKYQLNIVYFGNFVLHMPTHLSITCKITPTMNKKFEKCLIFTLQGLKVAVHWRRKYPLYELPVAPHVGVDRAAVASVCHARQGSVEFLVAPDITQDIS